MPVDTFNVKKIYPDSVRNPMSWSAGSTTDPRVQLGGTLDSWSKSGDVFTFQGNDAARLNIWTTSGYNPSAINSNHKEIAARGYMQDTKDWRDIEMTAYIKLSAGADDQFVMYCRGGKHGSNATSPCEGFAYKTDLYFSGKVRLAKEQWHVSYEFTNDQPGMGSIEDKWVGMKSMFYNNKANTEVTCEIWLDKNADGTWTKVYTYVDKGGFGSDGAKCGGRSDQIGTWAGPTATFRWDGVDTISMKWFSVREIDPFGQFTDGGTGTGTTGGTGGTGTGTTGGTGGTHLVCTDNPVIETGAGGLVAGDCNKTLYKLTGKSMSFNDTGYKERHYASGKPDTISREWNAPNCPYLNYETTIYITIANPDDDSDDVSIKHYGGTHQDGQGHWYIYDVEFDSGKTGWGYEQPHPTTTSYSNTGNSVGSIIDKKCGMKTVIYEKGTGAHVISYHDKGDGKWLKVTEMDNPGGKVWHKESGRPQNIQVRIDACPHITMHCVSCKEIVFPVEFIGSGTGDTGGGGGGTGGGTGGGQDCVEVPDDPVEVPPDETEGQPSGSGGGNQNEPKPVMTVSRDFTFIHNVGVDTDDNCTSGNPMEVKQPEAIYNVSGETDVYRDLGYAFNFTEGGTAVGIYINSTKSILYDKIPKKVIVNAIHRTIDAALESITGLVKCDIVRFSDNTTMATIGGTYNVAGIDVVDQELVFEQLDNEYQLKVGDMILLKYASVDANAERCLKIKSTTKDTVDGMNTYLIAREYKGLRGYWDQDIGFQVFV